MDRNLARAVTEKRPVPEIDFSLHTMEDGSQVSTTERVVKGNHEKKKLSFLSFLFPIADGFLRRQRSKRRP